MNFYNICDPMRPAEYAMFSHLGTWTDGDVCPACGACSQRLTEPLLVEWEPGTKKIGDFSWCSYTCITTPRATDFLRANAFECTFGEVQVVAPKKASRVPRVPFPYTGPPLNWIIASELISIDTGASKVSLLTDCRKCDTKKFAFKRNELVIRRRNWNGEKLFRVLEFGNSSAKFLTDEGLQLLSSQQFSNYKVRLAGRIEE